MKNLFVLIILALCIECNGQTFHATDLDAEYFQMKVKSIDDFIGRFNYSMDPSGKTLKYADSLQGKRLLLIRSLFDKSLLESNKDTSEARTVVDFLVKVAEGSNPLFFDFYSPLWHATSACPALLNGRKVMVTIFIRPVKNEKGNEKWEIFGAKDDFLDFGKANPEIIIGPAAHNLNFLDVSKTTTANPQHFIGFLPDDFKPDRLSVITWMISNKMLKLEPFTKVSFDIYQIPGFYFRVENINREGPNSGWLITHIEKR